MEDVEEVAGAAGADALLLKPFRPLELLAVVERLAGARVGAPMRRSPDAAPARSSSCSTRATCASCVEIERAQRVLLESAYQETVSALATRARDEGHGHAPALAAGAALRARARAP